LNPKGYIKQHCPTSRCTGRQFRCAPLPAGYAERWTKDKLNRLKKYLHAYMTIFKSNVRASKLHTIYVDAFAGTGYRYIEKQSSDQVLLPFLDDDDVISFQKGSAYIALETKPSFNEFL
jgi:three-Cys-motif partner protein